MSRKIPPRASEVYQVLWRWHFIIGLIVLPFAVIIGITGIAYLFRPHIENIIYHEYRRVQVLNTKELSADKIIDTAKSKYPAEKLEAYIPPDTIYAPAVVQFSDNKERFGWLKVYIDPYTGKILGHQRRSDLIMEKVRNLHGELLLGKFGTKFVELTACLLIVLIVTGWYLWWPRNKASLYGTFVPRLRSGPKIFWRDIHAVISFYLSPFILMMLFSGLPWTDIWGGSLNVIQKKLRQNPPRSLSAQNYKSDNPHGLANLSIDAVVKKAHDLGHTSNFAIKMPSGPQGVYTLEYEPKDIWQKTTIHLNQYTGHVIKEVPFTQYPLIAQSKLIGIRLHQGEHFGMANFVLVAFTGVGFCFMCFSATMLWLKRKPPIGIGVPKRQDIQIGKGLFAAILAMGVLFPAFGIVLVAISLIHPLRQALTLKKQRGA